MPDDITYGSYLKLDALLNAQEPTTGQHDETLFIIVHHVTELWMKQIVHELEAAIRFIDAGETDPAQKCLARVCAIQALSTQSWGVLSTMTPPDYLSFRDALGGGSGFQSYQFRTLEYLLGLKDARHLKTHEATPEHHANLKASLESPSLYDAALKRLAARGVAVPAAALDRDWSQPYAANDAVEEAWLQVYRNPEKFWDLYELAEKLVDLEDAFQVWRFRHVKTVERIIGRKRGTGGTSGVDYLITGLDKRCFPELWSLRTKL